MFCVSQRSVWNVLVMESLRHRTQL
jgi:hypothetical protein